MSKKGEKEIEIPKEWEAEEEPIKKKPRFRIGKPQKKFRIKGLRWINRGIAVILLFFNFFISQLVLATGPLEIKVIWGLIFLGNTYIHAHYLWKTRRVSD